ncbi:hypothetical protein CLV30_104304 [Haloactinopolyspora alba]|uniref:Maltokinase N-terminal cap domain-containing protein n=1 Tax=Haloactinopolyspora alba TaxID=648780 RepID=A0A2P8E7I4_9ACTN|nr:hypothetical protein [Haloactinopolyspora alba]PSL05434.1 hypothetical protein CLV30_104304 [Haloactinopolyspora alba]
MALIYKATLTPNKRELLSSWLPSRPWSGHAEIEQIGAYRFDDPDGEVGLEAFLVRAPDGTMLHAPLTYRGAPLPGAEAFLVGTTEHSVLGQRWVYDGCGDPVWVAELAKAVLENKPQAVEMVDVDGDLTPREPTMTVQSRSAGDVAVPRIDTLDSHDDGDTTVVRAGGLELVVARVVGADVAAEHTLTGTWRDGGPATLAGVRRAT